MEIVKLDLLDGSPIEVAVAGLDADRLARFISDAAALFNSQGATPPAPPTTGHGVEPARFEMNYKNATAMQIIHLPTTVETEARAKLLVSQCGEAGVQATYEPLYKAPPATPEKVGVPDETGWLIEEYEHIGAHRWLRLIEDQYSSGSNVRLFWSYDANLALRFSREEDARLFASMNRDFVGICRITEHRFLASLATPPTTASGAEVSGVQDETGWLIEAQGPVYLGPQNDGILGWTGDAGCAIRFSRKLDAQRYIDLEGLSGASPVEHMWCGGPIAEKAE